jgi:hypothetical protein
VWEVEEVVLADGKSPVLLLEDVFVPQVHIEKE